MILSKCFNLFKTSSSSVFAATIFAQMAIKSVSISSFTIYTSFAISSSISTLGATIFTTLHNTEVYLLTIISNRDDSLLSGNIAFSFGLTVSRGGLPGIMGGTEFKKGSILACQKYIFASNLLQCSFQPQLGVVGYHLPTSPCDHGALQF